MGAAMPVTRTLCMVTSALCADVLENVLQHLPLGAQELSTQHVENLVEEFSHWPMAPAAPSYCIPPQGTVEALTAGPMNSAARSSSSRKRRNKAGVQVDDLARIMRQEYEAGGHPAAYEVIAAVLSVFVQMDALV